MKPTVLLVTTTRWVPTARLAIALADAGFTVEAVCPSGHPLSKTSILRRSHAYRGLAPLKSISDAISATRPDLIVPGDDLATLQLHQLHERERSAGKPGVPICDLIERSLGAPEGFPAAFARSTFMGLVAEEGILSPKTEVIADSDALRKWASCNGFPFVLKADGTSGGRGVRIVQTLKEAEGAYRKLTAPPMLARAGKHALLDADYTLIRPSLLRRRSLVSAQAFVRGREATSAIACWNGNVLASLHFEVIKKAQTLGHATVVRVVENKQMSIAAERIGRRLRLSGLYGLDFMLAEKTGEAHLIEMNPRATQVGHLTLGAGRDLPAALFSAVSGQALNPAPIRTQNETITLFPQEWIRDASSPFLESGYHDIPWQEPDLVRACVVSRDKQRSWYSKLTESSLLNEDSVTPGGEVFGPLGNHVNSGAPKVAGRVLSTLRTDLPPAKTLHDQSNPSL